MWGPTMLGTCQIERYRSDGFLTDIRVMSREETRRYRNSFDELEAEQGREVSQNGMTDAHLDHRFVWEIGTHPRILECVTDLIGPDVLLLGSHFFCKYGPEEKFVAWHQDLRYWGLEPLLSLSVWYEPALATPDQAATLDPQSERAPLLHNRHRLDFKQEVWMGHAGDLDS